MLTQTEKTVAIEYFDDSFVELYKAFIAKGLTLIPEYFTGKIEYGYTEGSDYDVWQDRSNGFEFAVYKHGERMIASNNAHAIAQYFANKA